MQQFLSVSTSEVSFSAALANAVSQADVAANNAVKIMIDIIGQSEEGGVFTVKVKVEVVEESDLTPEELAELKGERALYESHEFEHGEVTHEFDEEAAVIVASSPDVGIVEEVIPTPITDEIEQKDQDSDLTPALVTKDEEPSEVNSSSAGTEWGDKDEIIRDQKPDKKNDKDHTKDRADEIKPTAVND